MLLVRGPTARLISRHGRRALRLAQPRLAAVSTGSAIRASNIYRGRVVVIGKTGRNFAAGMSGGVAYVLDEDGTLKNNCNLETVALERLDDRDVQEIEELLKRHAMYTRSARAWKILALWEENAPKFVKVMPKDYRRAFEALQEAEANGLTGDDALMAAFEANKSDASRVSGN